MNKKLGLAGLVLGAAVLFAGIGSAKDHDDYQKGTLLKMESASCGTQEKGSKTVAGELLGTDGESKKTQQMLCQEYVLQAERVVYKIRPKDDKHPALLPIGETAFFRIHKDKLVLKVPESGNDKEREYIVVSMTPRENPQAQVATKN